MILDFALVLIVALFVFIGYKKGIIKSVYGLISLVVAGAGSYFGSKYLSNWFYTFFFEKSVNESIHQSISATAESVTASTESVFENLPDYVKNFVGFFKISEASLFDSDSTVQMIEADLQNTIKSAVVEILGFIFIIVLFILILILMKLLSKTILSVFEIPVIKQINGLFGMVFGLAEGLIICYIAVLVCRLIMPQTDNAVLDAEMINSSVVFSKIYYSEFITYITKIFTM